MPILNIQTSRELLFTVVGGEAEYQKGDQEGAAHTMYARGKQGKPIYEQVYLRSAAE